MARLSCLFFLLTALQVIALPVTTINEIAAEKRSSSEVDIPPEGDLPETDFPKGDFSTQLLGRWPAKIPFDQSLVRNKYLSIRFTQLGEAGTVVNTDKVEKLLYAKWTEINHQPPKARGPASLNLQYPGRDDYPWIGCRRYGATTQDPILWDNDQTMDFLYTLAAIIGQNGFVELDLELNQAVYNPVAECKVRFKYGDGWGPSPVVNTLKPTTETW